MIILVAKPTAPTRLVTAQHPLGSAAPSGASGFWPRRGLGVILKETEHIMRSLLKFTTAAAFVAAANVASYAAIKEINYPAVKVETPTLFTPDANFEKMRTALAEIITKKDAQALFARVGPTFVWLSNGGVSGQFDFGRDALHNFKVVFGFRESGKDDDLPTIDNSIWESLAAFNTEKTYYAAGDNLACGPMAATIADDAAFQRTRQRIAADDTTEWFFVLTDTPATATPAGTGAPVGRLAGKTALPVLNAHPPVPEGQSGPPATHLQVLMPTGKPGWIPMTAARPMVSDRLCYSATPSGDWKITAFDSVD
jgi:hypothetical protein